MPAPIGIATVHGQRGKTADKERAREVHVLIEHTSRHLKCPEA